MFALKRAAKCIVHLEPVLPGLAADSSTGSARIDGALSVQYKRRTGQNPANLLQQAVSVQAVSLQAVSVQAVSVEAVSVQAVSLQAVSVQAVSVEAVSVQGDALDVQLSPVRDGAACKNLMKSALKGRAASFRIISLALFWPKAFVLMAIA